MICSRCSLLGVLTAAMGLIALLASTAQAEVGAKWLVLKAGGAGLYSGAEIEANKEKFEGSLENSTLTLLSEIGGLKVALTCTAATLVDALLNATGGVKEGARVQFSGCKVFSGGANGLEKEQPKCIPKSGKGALGTLETQAFHALLKLHKLTNGELDDTILFLPDNAEEIWILIELGISCPFGEELPVYGLVSVQDCGGNKKALEHLTTHLITEFEPLTDLAWFAKRSEGGTPAKIDGSANISLASGRSFAGDPA